jgi:hypothetical protein
MHLSGAIILPTLSPGSSRGFLLGESVLYSSTNDVAVLGLHLGRYDLTVEPRRSNDGGPAPSEGLDHGPAGWGYESEEPAHEPNRFHGGVMVSSRLRFAVRLHPLSVGPTSPPA